MEMTVYQAREKLFDRLGKVPHYGMPGCELMDWLHRIAVSAHDKLPFPNDIDHATTLTQQQLDEFENKLEGLIKHG